MGPVADLEADVLDLVTAPGGLIIMAMAHRAAGLETRTAHNDGSATYSVDATETKSLTARDKLKLKALYRRATNPVRSGRLIRVLAAEIEAELFGLSRWRRISEDRPISEWGA